MFNLPLWRDLSLIFLVVELIIALVPVLVLLFFCAKYVPQGIRWLSSTLRAIRRTTERVRRTTLQIGQRIISPFVAIRQCVAAGKSMTRAALTITRGK